MKSDNRMLKVLGFITILVFGLENLSMAQDILVKTSGKKVETRIKEITDSYVKYYRWETRSSGMIHYIDKNKVEKIIYQDGSVLEITKSLDDIYATDNVQDIRYIPENNTTRGVLNKNDDFGKPKRHIVYGEILGMSGFFSVNYAPTIVQSPNGAFAIRARLGIGMSNKSIHVPHGVLFAFGSVKHQFEIGFQGALIAGLADGDVFEFLHSEGKSTRYSFSPTIGYRLISKTGFTFNFNIYVISAENASGIQGPPPAYGKSAELSPWFGIGLGYAF